MTPTDLRSLRLALRLTQAQLASKLAVSRNTVQRWECGTSRIPGAVQQLLEGWKREQMY
jgi:DNA-binding transcriptional regulator YiaG